LVLFLKKKNISYRLNSNTFKYLISDFATIHQGQLPSSPSIDAEDPRFNLDWLLSSNSHHALLCGDTGAGKTVLARWLLGQLGISDVTVLDPDDDGQTWRGFQTVGTDDDWKAIDTAYLPASMLRIHASTSIGFYPQTLTTLCFAVILGRVRLF